MCISLSFCTYTLDLYLAVAVYNSVYLVSMQPACVFDEIIEGERSPTSSLTTYLSTSNNFQDTIHSFSIEKVSLC